ncbi:MAG: ATP-binding protein [Pseudomonadota bacterium]
MTGLQTVKRIIVTGAESTGSTTLARALAAELGCEWVPEYGRDYTAKRDGGPPAPWRDDEFLLIAEQQIALENEAAERSAAGWLVCDTDALATVIWQERYMGRSTPAVRDAAQDQVLPFARLLTGDEIPFEDDGQRDGAHIRHDMQARFREALDGAEGRGVPWIEVRGSVPERLSAAMRFIDQILEQSRSS